MTVQMKLLAWLGLSAYLVFVIFIFIGGVYITKILYNSNISQLACVGLDDTNELNIAKITIVLFWMVFIPLCVLPIILALGLGHKFFI
jgi:hypothetical protein